MSFYPTTDAKGKIVGYECDIRSKRHGVRIHRRWRLNAVTTKTMAKEEYIELRRKVRRGEPVEDPARVAAPTFAEFAAYYLESCQPNQEGGGDSAAWHERKTRELAPRKSGELPPLLKHFGPMRLTEIDRAEIVAFRKEQQAAGFNNKTVNMLVGILSHVYTVAMDLSRERQEGPKHSRVPFALNVTVNPAKGLKKLAWRRPDPRLLKSQEDVEFMKFLLEGSGIPSWPPPEGFVLEAAAPPMGPVGRKSAIQALVPLYYILNRDTPCRTRDLKTLDWDRVFLDKGCIVFPPRKGKKAHAVPLTGDARRALAMLPQQKGLVFLGLGQSVYMALRYRIRAFGLRGLRPHDLRHTFAVDFLDAGGDKDALQKLAGWSDPRMVDYYGELASRRHVTDMQKLDDYREELRGLVALSGGTSDAPECSGMLQKALQKGAEESDQEEVEASNLLEDLDLRRR